MMDARNFTRKLSFNVVVLAITCAGVAFAEDAPPKTPPGAQAPTAPAQKPPVSTTEPIIVTGLLDRAPAQEVPASLTVLDAQMLQNAGVLNIKQAAAYAPGVTIQEFTARKLSFPFFRGLGSGPLNPSVTTYIDGVPQLNANSSSVEFLDIDRVELLRGTQGALYGRNTIGGVVNIVSRRPDLQQWTFSPEASGGNYNFQDYRFTLSGPIVANQLALSLSGGYSSRDGFTKNNVTGHDLDDREGQFGRGTLLWTPSPDWEFRLNIYGERGRDGDFALGDLASIRNTPHRVSHDFEGFTRRDLASPSLTINHYGEAVDFTSITGYATWTTADSTDLDAGPLPIALRTNDEQMWQFTQEFRIASAENAPVIIADNIQMRWMAGLFTFHSEYGQDILNSFPNGLQLPGPINLPPFSNATSAAIQNNGIGIFGQSVFTVGKALDISLGLRYDHEFSHGNTFNAASPVNAAQAVNAHNDFGHVSPRFEIGYHFTPEILAYISAANGFKSGGFNATAPAGKEAFGEETSWTYEVGMKTEWLNHRLQINGSLFYVNWHNLQLDVPNPTNPLLFFSDNVGNARSKGAELQVVFKPSDGWEIFGGAGYTDADFAAGSRALVNGVNTGIGGNTLPFAPDFNWNAGVQYSNRLCPDATLYARVEVMGTGEYFYDASNAASQDTFSVCNFRIGLHGDRWRLEGWIRNAFDEQYVPLALPSSFVQSGYIGESGAPQTFGITLGFDF